MSSSLPPLTFVLAFQYLVVPANTLESEFILGPRDGDDNGGDDGDDGNSTRNSSSTTSTSTSSTTTSTSTSNTTTSTSTSSTTTSTSTSSTTTSSTTTSSHGKYTSTLTSTSSGPTSTSTLNSNQQASTSNIEGLSTGLALGIMFLLILSAMLVCYFRRRSRKAREKAAEGPAILASEFTQYYPPASVASRDRELPTPPPLDTGNPNSSDILNSPLLNVGSNQNSHTVSAWNRYSTWSQPVDTPQSAAQNTLPNPHDPFLAPARSPSYASTMVSTVSSPPYSS